MRFHISNSYYRKQIASNLLWMLCLVVAVIASIYYLFQAAAVADFILPILGVAACSAYFIKLLRHIQLGRRAYPEIELDSEAKSLAVIHGESRVNVDIRHILNLKLQFRGKHLEQIQVTTDEGEVVRLEGYDQIAVLGDQLEKLTPEGNITRSRLRIR